MVSATENDATPIVVDSEIESPTAVVSLKQRLLMRLRPLQNRRLAIMIGAGTFSLLLLLWAIITLTIKADAPEVEPATQSPAEPERHAFQAALAHLVQSGDDTIRLYDFSPNSDQLETLACVERLKIIRIDAGTLTPQAGETLASMPHLEQLHFRGVSLDDATLDAIAKSKTIWLLNVSGAKLSPDAIARLADMPKLRQLRLAMENGGNRYTQSIAKITKLRALHLIGFGINDQSLKLLANLPNLESLYIDDSNVNDEGWKWLFENKPHLHVHIDQKHHDRDPQKH
jgi:hypothetical protein